MGKGGDEDDDVTCVRVGGYGGGFCFKQSKRCLLLADGVSGLLAVSPAPPDITRGMFDALLAVKSAPDMHSSYPSACSVSTSCSVLQFCAASPSAHTSK